MLFVTDSIQLVQLLPYEGDIKIQGQVIHTVKYADDVLLMAKEEIVLQGTTDRLTEIGRCYRMECGKTRVVRISREPSPIHMADQNSWRMWNI